MRSASLNFEDWSEGRLLRGNGLNLERDVDLVAEHHAAGCEWLIEDDAEIATVDARSRAPADAVVAPRIGDMTGDRAVEGDALRDAAQREVAADGERRAAAADRRADERH